MQKFLKTAVLLFMLICLFYLLSCEESVKEPTTTDLLAGKSSFGKTYKISQISVPLGVLEPHECVRDNNITYYPNGNYEVNEGVTKCSAEDPPSYTGNWLLNSATMQLTLVIGDSTQSFTIDQIDATNHQLTGQFAEGTRTYFLTRRD